MNTQLTEVIFILDRSGSMEHLTEETIGGFNSLIRQQQKEPGEVKVTTILFDDVTEVLHDCVPIAKIPRLTDREYYARGCTALLDAVGSTIDRVGNRLAETPEDDRPAHVLFVITTDGYENASHTYTKSKVKEMIRRQQSVYSWNFLFLGANIDSVSEADSIGVRPCMAANFSASEKGMRSTFKVTEKFLNCMKLSEANLDEATCASILSETE